MIPYSTVALEHARWLFDHLGLPAQWSKRQYLPSDKAYSNALIGRLLDSDSPCMVARLGYFELGIILNYLSIQSGQRPLFSYLAGRSSPWWWDRKLTGHLGNNAGFFPLDPWALEQFCQLMLDDVALTDILGSWLWSEKLLPQLAPSHRVEIHGLEPFFAPDPWTHALAGKKVLVIHPFVHSISQQHKRLEQIFPDGMMPRFDLCTIEAVQTIAGEKSRYPDWFAALDSMKAQMDAAQYDVCIIGAGAYGLPLAAHAKRSGKKAIHLGGVTQMLFGIVGRRWEDSREWPYPTLFNPCWVRPSAAESPTHARTVEGACYW